MGKTKQGQVGMGQRSLAQETWRRFKRNRLAIAGMVLGRNKRGRRFS